jgi:hypothetical protein
MIGAWPAQPSKPSELFTVSAKNHPYAYCALRTAPRNCIPIDDHADWQALFGILTPAGVTYFLPGLLRHLLAHLGESHSVLVALLSALSIEQDVPEDQAQRRRARVEAVKTLLGPEQRHIMAAFAEWVGQAMKDQNFGYAWLAEAFRDTWAQGF